MSLTLQTERLLLRNFRREDTPPLRQAVLRYQATPYAAYDHPWPSSQEGIAEVVAWFMTGDQYLAVCRRDTGCFLGFVCLNPEGPAAERTYNLGYIFDSEYHGQGYAGEAGRALLAHAFLELGATQVVAGTPLIHDASIRLLHRLGFVQISESEGFFRLTRADWERQRAAAQAQA
jgi:[ribosomal protein S5]-alanine N-acetyltransferase